MGAPPVAPIDSRAQSTGSMLHRNAVSKRTSCIQNAGGSGGQFGIYHWCWEDKCSFEWASILKQRGMLLDDSERYVFSEPGTMLPTARIITTPNVTPAGALFFYRSSWLETSRKIRHPVSSNPLCCSLSHAFTLPSHVEPEKHMTR